MVIDRLTWFGFCLAILGWIILALDTALTVAPTAFGALTLTTVMRSDIVPVAQVTIASGFALAVIGTLRTGFGALHRFFDAVLERANTPRPTTPMPMAATGTSAAPAPGGGGATTVSSLDPTELSPSPSLSPSASFRGRDKKASRGTGAKNYTILSNGAVEVETLLGTRVFASLDEARDYIR